MPRNEDLERQEQCDALTGKDGRNSCARSLRAKSAFCGRMNMHFDYIGTLASDIITFKHVSTKRSLNLAERDGRAVWCDFDSKIGVVEREVEEGFRYARNSP